MPMRYDDNVRFETISAMCVSVSITKSLKQQPASSFKCQPKSELQHHFMNDNLIDVRDLVIMIYRLQTAKSKCDYSLSFVDAPHSKQCRNSIFFLF